MAEKAIMEIVGKFNQHKITTKHNKTKTDFMIWYTPIEPAFGMDYDAIGDINVAVNLTFIY